MDNDIASPAAYLEVAQIARDFGILKAIAENEGVLVFIVDELFKHIRIVS